MAGLRFPIKDEACQGNSGLYFGKYHYRPSYHNSIKTRQISLGRTAVDIEDFVARADAELDVDRPISPVDIRHYAAAASVLRLCMAHGEGTEPVLEVVQNAIVTAPEPIRVTASGLFAGGQEDSDSGLHVGFPARIRLSPNEREWMGHDSHEVVAYLPHEDYSGANVTHAAILTQPPSGYALHIGLLGGERILERSL